SAAGRSPNSASRSEASVATNKWVRFSYSASSRIRPSMPVTSRGVASRTISVMPLGLLGYVRQDDFDSSEAACHPVIDMTGDPQQHEAENRVQQHRTEKNRTGLGRSLAEVRD